jgi:hypothetical protein
MKNLLSMIVIGAVMLSTLDSCSKDDPIQNNGTSSHPTPLNLTTSGWEEIGSGMFVSTFKNVVPAEIASYRVNIYLVTNGTDILINSPIRYMDAALWAACSQRDIRIFCRGNLENALPLNIKVVFQ